ncbi:hypothetical protein CLF_112907 [Clonorchis sinensis]|uniref:Apple domain-containing protein n=1 Tax=Clonorchis sinensis TaxID=79923 RepID=G7YX90_CLOSI|nr:hypothetical protein CLF_112907 [Clonorchis sinensis]
MLIFSLYALLQQALQAQSGCPSDYFIISPHLCVIDLGGAPTFCRASQMCATFGAARGHLAFLVGRNARQIMRQLPEKTNLWLGLNQFLTEVSPSTVGWRDVDPRTPEYKTVGGEIIWSNGEPDGGDPIIISKCKNAIMYDCSTTCDWVTLSVFCEYGGPLPTGILRQMYHSEFPMRLANFIETDPNWFGCYQDVDAFSALDCAHKCTMDVACRSIYYDPSNGDAARRCVHMMYADARLRSTVKSDKAEWRRYAKTSYVGN